MQEKLVLIDGHSILNRAYYGVPDLTNAEGLHTNAVYGFLNIMFKILDEEKPDYFAVAFDLKKPTFRHKMYDAYKGTRKPMQEELRQQVPVMKELLSAMNVPLMMLEGYEADDLLGTAAKAAEAKGLTVSVISGDRDLLQLATDRIQIRIPKTKKGGTEIENYFTADVIEKYMVTPPQIVDLKALMGDTSDNIPGIPGVGEKTAGKIISQFGSIENAYANIEEVKPNKARESLREHYDLAELSKKLAKIDTDVPFVLDMEAAKLENLFTPEAFEICRRLEFKQILSRFDCEEPVNAVTDFFRKIDDLSETERIFEAAAQADLCGFSLLCEKDDFLGVTLCFGEQEIYFLPTGGFQTEEYLSGKCLELLGKCKKSVTIGLKEQLKWLPVTKKMRPVLKDAKIGAYLINPLKGQYLADDIAKDHADLLISSKWERFGKTLLRTALQEQEEKVTEYACYLSYTAWKAWPQIETKLEELQMTALFDEIEMPLVYTLFEMQQEGVRVDAKSLKAYGDELQVRVEQLEQEIYADAGEIFNINSPKQLGIVLFENMKLPGAKKTKSGYSTAVDVLDKLAPDYPIVSKILEYRQVAKLKSTYADGLANFIQEDGRIHGNFHQTITATGRISSTDPNLQNIPIRTELGRMLRKIFIAKEGYVLIDADYSQIELRVLAALSEDETLIHAFANDMDIHRLTASQVFHVPFEEVSDLQRRNAKAVNFGIVYGISAFGLSEDLKISVREAGDYIDQYFATYPKIKEFLDAAVNGAKEHGYVTTLFGRRRPVPELSSSNFMQRSFGERVAMNSPIQGTAADIIKIAMIRVNERLREENFRSRLILQVHDELLVEAAEDEVEAVKQVVFEEMTQAVQMKVSMEVELNCGSSWFEAH
ncbi:MAG: DNA polymerase I [Marvinbryantia sp.]|jgi:DNA polymerase-1